MNAVNCQYEIERHLAEESPPCKPRHCPAPTTANTATMYHCLIPLQNTRTKDKASCRDAACKANGILLVPNEAIKSKYWTGGVRCFDSYLKLTNSAPPRKNRVAHPCTCRTPNQNEVDHSRITSSWFTPPCFFSQILKSNS